MDFNKLVVSHVMLRLFIYLTYNQYKHFCEDCNTFVTCLREYFYFCVNSIRASVNVKLTTI